MSSPNLPSLRTQGDFYKSVISAYLVRSGQKRRLIQKLNVVENPRDYSIKKVRGTQDWSVLDAPTDLRTPKHYLPAHNFLFPFV